MRNREREAAWLKRLQRIGEWIEWLEQGENVKGLQGGRISEVRCKLNTGDQGETLVVVKAQDASGEWVGFVGARNLAEAFLTWRQKEGGRGLRWREDRSWADRYGADAE